MVFKLRKFKTNRSRNFFEGRSKKKFIERNEAEGFNFVIIVFHLFKAE